MVHTQFKNRALVIRAEAEQHLRHANIVIQIALGREHGRRATQVRRKDRAQHFFHRRLAIAAGYCEYRHRKASPPYLCEASQRQPRITNENLRDGDIVNYARHQCSGGTAFGGTRDIPVTVKIRTAERNEKFTPF